MIIKHKFPKNMRNYRETSNIYLQEKDTHTQAHKKPILLYIPFSCAEHPTNFVSEHIRTPGNNKYISFGVLCLYDERFIFPLLNTVRPRRDGFVERGGWWGVANSKMGSLGATSAPPVSLMNIVFYLHVSAFSSSSWGAKRFPNDEYGRLGFVCLLCSLGQLAS